MKYGTERHTEEFVLRELYREHNREGDGSLTLVELKAMLNKINITAQDQYLEALVKHIDVNGTGVIEFEEFVAFLVQDRYTKQSLKV